MAELRNAREADLPRIVAIYNAAIPGRLATADTSPVSVEDRRAWFAGHQEDRHPIWILEEGDEAMGWVSLRPFYGRPAYHATAEISVYVSPEHQGKGHAKRLLSEMIAACPQLGIRTLLAFVFSHNDPSLRSFQRAGFEAWGQLPAVAELDGTWRDLSILGLKIGG